ncbi:glutathione binding-like protein [Paraburkholderia sp. SOS3]|uniref:glutathione binding-like protein n=1 Tax=Paraburkholderia sp. SOS3 TaxID=1926494 RepID=UPI001E46FF6C|nr:glutathione binding-like protein [Paraburkholderia sp. SOS3]
MLDALLFEQSFVAGNDYSIADIAHFGWIWRRAFPDLTLDETPHVQRWCDTIPGRPAVARAIAKVEELTVAAG